MKRFLIAACAALLPGLSALAADAPRPGIVLSSSSFTDGGIIPDKHTANSPAPVSPALSWINTPPGTQSFALIFHDPDTALQRKTDDVLHWLMFNIPGSVTSLPEGVENTAQLPDGSIQGKNFYDKPGFLGPASPLVYHHYMFELFALDTKLALGPDATRADVINAMNGHILGKGVVAGRFHR